MVPAQVTWVHEHGDCAGCSFDQHGSPPHHVHCCGWRAAGPGLVCLPFNPGCSKNCLGRTYCLGGWDCWQDEPDEDPKINQCNKALQVCGHRSLCSMSGGMCTSVEEGAISPCMGKVCHVSGQVL
jgi:hypothetical protein